MFWFLKIILFIFGCVGSLLCSWTHPVVASGGCSLVTAQTAHCSGFSWTRGLQSAGSVVAHRLFLCGIWALPRPGTGVPCIGR